MNSNPTQTLETLRESLKPKPQQVPAAPQKSVTLTDALLKIPELTELLKQVIAIKQKETNIVNDLTKIDFSIQTLVNQSNRNLKQIDSVNDAINSRIVQFNLLEAKYNRMIEHVSDVLTEIERVLKQF